MEVAPFDDDPPLGHVREWRGANSYPEPKSLPTLNSLLARPRGDQGDRIHLWVGDLFSIRVDVLMKDARQKFDNEILDERVVDALAPPDDVFWDVECVEDRTRLLDDRTRVEFTDPLGMQHIEIGLLHAVAPQLSEARAPTEREVTALRHVYTQTIGHARSLYANTMAIGGLSLGGWDAEAAARVATDAMWKDLAESVYSSISVVFVFDGEDGEELRDVYENAFRATIAQTQVQAAVSR